MCITGHGAVVRKLVESKADVNAPQHESHRTPLMGAALEGKLKTCTTLIDLKVVLFEYNVASVVLLF